MQAVRRMTVAAPGVRRMASYAPGKSSRLSLFASCVIFTIALLTFPPFFNCIAGNPNRARKAVEVSQAQRRPGDPDLIPLRTGYQWQPFPQCAGESLEEGYG